MQSRPTVFVYHDELLPYSATFIRTQAAALQSFKAGFAGLFPSRRISLDLNLDFPAVLLTKDHSLPSRLRRNIFKRTGLGARKFLNELSARSPALLHAHFALDASIALPITEQLGIPLITTLHGYDVTIRDEILSRSLEGQIYLKRRERLWEKCAHFFCSCDYIRGRAIERGYPAEKLETLYSGHDLAKFARRNPEARRPSADLGVVGHVDVFAPASWLAELWRWDDRQSGISRGYATRASMRRFYGTL